MSSQSEEHKGYTADEYRQKRLIQTILDDAKKVKEQRDHAEDLRHHGTIDEMTAQRMYRMAVEDFIIDSKFKIQDTDQTVEVVTNDGDEHDEISCWEWFWHRTYLGSLDIPGRAEAFVFTGLKSIREFPDPLQVQVEQVEHDLVRGQTSDVEWHAYQVPWQVSKKAYEELLDFWGMHGLHVTTDDGVPTWSFNEKPDEPPEEAVEI